jgi:hypothetical protein
LEKFFLTLHRGGPRRRAPIGKENNRLEDLVLRKGLDCVLTTKQDKIQWSWLGARHPAGNELPPHHVEDAVFAEKKFQFVLFYFIQYVDR